LKQNHAEYEEVLTSFLAEGQKRRFVGDNLDIRPLANSLIALWNGLETLLVSGLTVEEARRAWLEALKSDLHESAHKQITIPRSGLLDLLEDWIGNAQVLAQ